jgi:hypothetical protein
LSRHAYVKRRNRSKFVVIVAAGAFTVASAATATAMTWPSGSVAASPGDLTTFTQSQDSVATQQTRYEIAQRAEEISLAEAKQAAAQKKAAAELAAKRAVNAAARAAAAKAAAARAASEAAAAAVASEAAAQKAAAAAQKKAQQAVASAQASGTPEQIATAMLSQYGWSGSQMSCLQPLWERESGWSVSAYNASSGAFGIPQALPGSKMASAGSDWQTSAATQIKWGLGYIRDVYGSPCGAWNHELADGWY